MAGQVHVIDHPLVQHKLSLMRMKSTSTSAFRNLLGELSMLMAYEVTRDLPTHAVQIDTPLTRTNAPMLDGKKIVLVSILRAGTPGYASSASRRRSAASFVAASRCSVWMSGAASSSQFTMNWRKPSGWNVA